MEPITQIAPIAPKNKGGRQNTEDVKFSATKVLRLKPYQLEKLIALGGSVWMRRMIDEAK